MAGKLTQDVFAWARGEAVLFSTISDFKGMEAEAVVLTDLVDFNETFFKPADLYLACSRALGELVLVTSSAEMAGRLTP